MIATEPVFVPTVVGRDSSDPTGARYFGFAGAPLKIQLSQSTRACR